MKNILVPFTTDPANRTAVRAACQVAALFDGVVEGMFVHVPVQIVVNEMVPTAYVTQMSEQRQADADAAKALYLDAIREAGFSYSDNPASTESRTATWSEHKGQPDLVIGEYARLVDLTVISKASEEMVSDWETNLEAALFESGRPVLLVPNRDYESINGHVAIAWNGSTETAATIGLAMPFLKRAEKVTVVAIEGGSVPGPTGAQMALSLARHGIDAEAVLQKKTAGSIGETVLQQAEAMGVDLIIKGAYTQNRLRQMIFGGATRHIIAHAKVPVFMAR